METATESRLASVLRDVEKGIDEATAILDFTTDRAELDDAMFELIRLGNKFDALQSQLATTAKSAGIHCGSRIRSMSSYVAAQSNTSPLPIRQAARRGDWLRGFSRFAQAHRDGDLSAEHIDFIRTRLDTNNTRTDLRASQVDLIEHARNLTFADFKTAAEYWSTLR